MKIIIKTKIIEFEAKLNQSKIAKAIYEKLPIESRVNCWGEEIYFKIPLQHPQENPTLNLEIGDLAYWPEGNSLCIFFGRTPASTNDQPRPASEVDLIGKTEAKPELLHKIPEGTKIIVAKNCTK